jgi:multicomponent Na+:H+ antiporter subunit D
MVGVPLTVGFVSKWYLVLGALDAGLWPVAALILVSSILALIYIWRVVEVGYFKEPPEGTEDVKEAPISMLIPTWILIGSTLVFGIWTSLSAGVASAAARMLIEGTP